VANPQTQRSDFRSIDVDAGSIWLGGGGDAVAGQQFDQALFHARDQITYAETELAYVQQQVGDQLARAMISHLPAAIDLYDRDIARQQQMFGFAGLALGEHWRVLDQPDFVGGIAATFVGEALHGMPDRLISHLAKFAKAQRARHHNTMCTKPVARSSLLMLYS